MIRHHQVTQFTGYYLIHASIVTTCLASLVALRETDLKKIVALSTLSQLGLIMTIVSLGIKGLAFFHLLAHAFFKALTFMAAGTIIHSNTGYQDTR